MVFTLGQGISSIRDYYLEISEHSDVRIVANEVLPVLLRLMSNETNRVLRIGNESLLPTGSFDDREAQVIRPDSNFN